MFCVGVVAAVEVGCGVVSEVVGEVVGWVVLEVVGEVVACGAKYVLMSV